VCCRQVLDKPNSDRAAHSVGIADGIAVIVHCAQHASTPRLNSFQHLARRLLLGMAPGCPAAVLQMTGVWTCRTAAVLPGRVHCVVWDACSVGSFPTSAVSSSRLQATTARTVLHAKHLLGTRQYWRYD
jgi:hypothetical protein